MTVPTAATQPEATVRQRVRARLVAFAASLLVVLPEGPINAIGDAAGLLWYRVAPARAVRARQNLRRVAQHLVHRGLGGEVIRSAAPTIGRSRASSGRPSDRRSATTSTWRGFLGAVSRISNGA